MYCNKVNTTKINHTIDARLSYGLFFSKPEALQQQQTTLHLNLTLFIQLCSLSIDYSRNSGLKMGMYSGYYTSPV